MLRAWMSAKSVVAGLSLLALSLGSTGCQSKMYDQNRALHTQNRQLQQHLTSTRQELAAAPDPAQLAALQQQVAERDRMIAELQSQLREPAPGEARIPGIEGLDVTFNEARGEMTVAVPGDVLFGSGQSDVKKTAEATLSKIANALKTDYAGKRIRVEGHTDSDPIVKTKNLYKDNRELSMKRAYSVTKFLESHGVAGDRIETVGHGQYRPRSGSKAQNRRVEIIVVM